jgi:C4-dicarboxylate transporter DctM subunit
LTLCKPARDLPEACPAFAMNIFVAQSVLDLESKSIYRGIIPFLLIYLLALILSTYVPVISLGGMRLLLGVN